MTHEAQMRLPYEPLPEIFCPHCGADLVQDGVTAHLDATIIYESTIVQHWFTAEPVLVMERSDENIHDKDRLWYCQSCEAELPSEIAEAFEDMEPF